ncbi:hypothetical protein BSKO_09600 [Bryopsis sp. KO-2023]|nr:hypothetical protein BSKO_09600 [Bryopsis sp. KO-2023]
MDPIRSTPDRFVLVIFCLVCWAHVAAAGFAWQTGPRQCNSLWADIQGSVISEANAASPADCCRLCRENSSCNAWTYCSDNSCSGRCTMKSVDQSNPQFKSVGKGASGSLISGVITDTVHISRGNNFVNGGNIPDDGNLCSSACSGASENDCWIIAPTDNVLSEPQEAGALKYMLNGQVKDSRSAAGPEKSGILDFVVSADMRLATAALGGVFPIQICGQEMCSKYCSGRSFVWKATEKEAFRTCILSKAKSGMLTLEACMVQQQPIVGGHLAPRPEWCSSLDGGFGGGDCSGYGPAEVSALCCLKGLY